MAGFNQQFILSISIIFVGFILKQTGLLKESDGEAVSRVVFNLTLPALIIISFHNIIFDWSLLIVVVSGLVFGFVFAIVGILFFANKSKTIKGMLVMMMPGFNVALFAYPLVEGVWGVEGIKYFGMLDVGNAFIVFGLSYLLGSYYADDQSQLTLAVALKKLTRSVPLMTYFFIFAINMLSFELPNVVLNTASTIAVANMPLSLLLLGLYVDLRFNKAYVKMILSYIGLRYGVAILIGTSLYVFLPVSEMIKLTLLIGLILPIPLSLIPYGVEFGYDKRFIGTVSNVTMLLSFLLIWIIVNLTV
ncbi:hypothetical protein SAMN04488134_101623 [Amphibacillus marinus]|uniref:Malonate transporter n=1 Tax=Amphibacillus marinus TaxID=872970 RepID=A0A1H8IIM3_9BACI|nr:AEC family transporter [Amphibacillus marinus]SEN68046.1 hypothetical protein SAMN04488134_101623 [Amphibacillus marinus]